MLIAINVQRERTAPLLTDTHHDTIKNNEEEADTFLLPVDERCIL